MKGLKELQDEALSYLRDNITKDEAYYILTTSKDMVKVLISRRKDGSKRIKILDTDYTIEKEDDLLLFDTDGLIDGCLITARCAGINMYFRKSDIGNMMSLRDGLKVVGYKYISVQLDNIPTIEKRRIVFELTGHRVAQDDPEKINFMFTYFMARLCG